MAESTRELKMRLTVVPPDTAPATRAYEAIANSAKNASLAVQDAQKQMQRMQGPAAATDVGPGTGLSSAASTYYDKRLARERADLAVAMANGGQLPARPGSISWTRPGFTGAPGSGYGSPSILSGLIAPVPPVAAPAATSSLVPHVLQGPGSAIHGASPTRTTASVPAFDRPQAVVIVGPKPLPVAVVGGNGGAAAGGGGESSRFPKAATPKGPDAFQRLAGGVTQAVGYTAAAAVAVSAFGTITEAAAKMNDPLATSADRLQTLAKAVPLFGDSLASMVGSVTSAVGRLQDWEGGLKRDRAMQQHPLVMARQQIEFERREKMDSLERRSRDAGDSLAARQARPSVAYEMQEKLQGASGLSGLLARGAWENKDDRLKAGMEAVRDAERALSQSQNGLAGAKVDVTMTSGQRARADADREAARRAQEEAAKNAGVGEPDKGFSFKRAFKTGGAAELTRSGAQSNKAEVYKESLREEEKAIVAQQDALRRQQEAQERLGQKSLEVAQKQYELEKRRIELQKTRVELLQEEYQRTQNVARTFGAMTSVDQEGVLADLKRFKEGGREALTEGSFSRLSSVLPEFVGKQLEGKTKDSPLLKDLLEQTGMRDAEVIQKELKPLKAELTVKAEFNERQYLDATKKAADELVSKLKPLLDAISKASADMVENKYKQNRGG